MVKYISIIMLVVFQLHATNIFEENCVKCHQSLPVSLKDIFKRYLIVYSGEENVKAGLKHYLLYPSKDISVMSQLFINIYGIKEKTHLDDEKLKKAIDIYWDSYKVFGKLH